MYDIVPVTSIVFVRFNQSDGVPAGGTPPPPKRGRRKVVKADAGLAASATAASLSSVTTAAAGSAPLLENGIGASPSEQANGTESELTSKDVLWRLNFEEYYLRLVGCQVVAGMGIYYYGEHVSNTIACHSGFGIRP